MKYEDKEAAAQGIFGALGFTGSIVAAYRWLPLLIPGVCNSPEGCGFQLARVAAGFGFVVAGVIASVRLATHVAETVFGDTQ